MKKKKTQTFSAYAEEAGKQLKNNGQVRTGRAYTGVVRRFAKFLGKEEVLFSDFAPATMTLYQEALLAEGLAMNTVSYYMRNLRVLYNRAHLDGLFKKKNDTLFKKVFTGVKETEKKALTKKELEALASLHTKRKEIYECLLYFLFCYYGRGISFVDLCFLRKKHIRNGSIYYCRKKTGKQLIIKITKPMRRILDYFSGETMDSPFLFPILKEKGSRSIRAQYENALCKQNRRLKEVAKLAGLTTPLTTHTARHTWATLAYQGGTALSMISQALGHSDERTTAIYLASFEDSVMDQLSEQMSQLLKEKLPFNIGDIPKGENIKEEEAF